MLYMIIARDKPGSGALRAETRPAHLDYVAGAGDRLKVAGPIQDDAGNPIGSVLLIEAGSETAARLFSENDPYARAGLFASVDILPYKAVMGRWMPPAA